MQSQTKTPLIVVMVFSVLTGLLSYFNYTPDPKLVNDSVAFADQAIPAIQMKNWLQLATALVSFGAFLFIYWKDRTRLRTLIILFALSVVGLDACKQSPPMPVDDVSVSSRTQTPRWPVKFFELDASADICGALASAGIKALHIGNFNYIFATTDANATEMSVGTMLSGASISASVDELTPSSLTYNSNTYYYIPSLSTSHPVYEKLEEYYPTLTEARLKALTVASPMLMEPIGSGERPITVYGNGEQCEDIEGCEIVNNCETEHEDLCVCGGLAFMFDPWVYYDED